MPHPSHFYIKYVIARELSANPPLTADAISLTFQYIGLPGVNEHEFDRTRQSMVFPTNFTFTNPRHQLTVDFMKSERIYSIWQTTDNESRVLKELMEHLRARDRIDVLLMGRVPSEEVAKWVNKQFNMNPAYTARMIDTYKHYFWNTDLLGINDWNTLLYGDPRADAMLAAYSCGPEQAFYRAGGNPVPEDPEFPLREYYRQAYYILEAQRYKSDSGQSIANRSRLAADLKAFYEMLYGRERGELDRMRKFKEFIMVKHPALYKTWEDLEGTHSGDGTDRKETKPKGDEDGSAN